MKKILLGVLFVSGFTFASWALNQIKIGLPKNFGGKK
jgi:hypothetical protein